MSADKHPAEVLADNAPIGDTDRAHAWIESARSMLRRIPALETSLQRANAQAEHFEREWYLRGDQIEALEAERDQLRAEVERLKDKLDKAETD